MYVVFLSVCLPRKCFGLSLLYSPLMRVSRLLRVAPRAGCEDGTGWLVVLCCSRAARPLVALLG